MANSAMKMAATTEKVFVALPAEFKAGQTTLSWVLGHFSSSGATVVITHVHVSPQMIPVSTCFLMLYMLLLCSVTEGICKHVNGCAMILAMRI